MVVLLVVLVGVPALLVALTWRNPRGAGRLPPVQMAARQERRERWLRPFRVTQVWSLRAVFAANVALIVAAALHGGSGLFGNRFALLVGASSVVNWSVQLFRWTNIQRRQVLGLEPPA